MAENLSGELEIYQKKYGVDYSIGDLTPTVCKLAGARFPLQSCAKVISPIAEKAEELFSREKVEKILIYNPDAIGDVLFQKYPADFEPLMHDVDFKIKSAAVMPSVTPVCFGTIFSGTSPEIHGIKAYEKPVLKVETIFDVLPECGKKVAIVTENESSIDKIFRGRNVDYFSIRTHEGTLKQVRHLISDSDYDVIIFYNGFYDSSLHHSGPYSEKSLEEMRKAIREYLELNVLTDKYWKNFNRMTVFAPDHGGHPVNDGFGTHGSDIAEDMVVNHFYRLKAME